MKPRRTPSGWIQLAMRLMTSLMKFCEAVNVCWSLWLTASMTKTSSPCPLHPEHVHRPVESHIGAWETIIAGPYHNLIPSAEIETPKASRTLRGRTWGGMSPSPITMRLGVWGSIISSPSGVRGRAPAENGFYAYFRSERSHLERPF